MQRRAFSRREARLNPWEFGCCRSRCRTLGTKRSSIQHRKLSSHPARSARAFSCRSGATDPVCRFRPVPECPAGSVSDPSQPRKRHLKIFRKRKNCWVETWYRHSVPSLMWSSWPYRERFRRKWNLEPGKFVNRRRKLDLTKLYGCRKGRSSVVDVGSRNRREFQPDRKPPAKLRIKQLRSIDFSFETIFILYRNWSTPNSQPADFFDSLALW